MLEDAVYSAHKWKSATSNMMRASHQLLDEFGPLASDVLYKKLVSRHVEVPNSHSFVQSMYLHGLCAVTVNPTRISYLFGNLGYKTVIYTATQDLLLGFKIGHAMYRSGFYNELHNVPKCTRVTRRMQSKLPETSFAVLRIYYPNAIKQISGINRNSYGATINLWHLLEDVGFAREIKHTRYNLKPIGKCIVEGVKKSKDQGYGAVLKYWKDEVQGKVHR